MSSTLRGAGGGSAPAAGYVELTGDLQPGHSRVGGGGTWRDPCALSCSLSTTWGRNG